ncbi:MAG TPA: flagellin, partial [Bacteroidota bacterium]|nr:flagellin [Bacteroidota bacterium]
MAQDVSLTSAMRANLLSLQNTVKLLGRTQERLATGKKVNSPLDNPTSYFAAQSHLNRANDLAARKDSMGEAIQTVQSANSGIESITTLIESAKSIAQAAVATSDATARAEYLTQYNEVLSQIDDMASDSGYRGTNLLGGNTLTVQFNEDGTSALDLEGFDAT